MAMRLRRWLFEIINNETLTYFRIDFHQRFLVIIENLDLDNELENGSDCLF